MNERDAAELVRAHDYEYLVMKYTPFCVSLKHRLREEIKDLSRRR